MSDTDSDDILPDLIQLDPMEAEDFLEEELSDSDIERNGGDSNIGNTSLNFDYSNQGDSDGGDSIGANGDESDGDESDSGNGSKGDGGNNGGPENTGKAVESPPGIQTPLPQPPRRQRAYVLIPPRLKARTSKEPVPPPADGVPVDLPGRDPDLPKFFELKSHPLAPDGHSGRIFLAYVNYSDESLTKLFSKSANMAPPTSQAEMKDRGFLALDPATNDIVILRNMYGSGKEDDDHLASWGVSKQDHSSTTINELDCLRKDMLGDVKDHYEGKPKLTEDGKYIGGIAFERHARAINIKGSKRAYQLATTFQTPKTLSAPGRQAKSSTSGVLDSDAMMRKSILRSGARIAMQGLHRFAPTKLLTRLRQQANISNLPAVGVHENFAYPAWQLNIASASNPGEAQRLDDSLGSFGTAHIDAGDSAAALTCMIILSEPHPDVKDEFFYVLDLGLCWKMEEYAALYFSGLHFHGGSQPVFAEPRTSDRPAERLTLIGYLPDPVIEGNNAVAFAALPKGKVLEIGTEMRNPLSHRLSNRLSCEHSTFTTDGSSLLEPLSHLNHFTRCLTEAVATFCSQYPPNALLRFDKDRLISSFSAVIDGKRVAPEPWEYGPGWSGINTEIGKDYSQILSNLGVETVDELPEEQLARLYNSDTLSEAPYGQEHIQKINENWAVLYKEYAQHIPICILTEGLSPIHGRANKKPGRQSAISQARKGESLKPSQKRRNQEDETATSPRPNKRARKSAPLPDRTASTQLSKRKSISERLSSQPTSDAAQDSIPKRDGNSNLHDAPAFGGTVGKKHSSRLTLKFLTGGSRFECFIGRITQDRLDDLLVLALGENDCTASLTQTSDSLALSGCIAHLDRPITADARQLWDLFRGYKQHYQVSSINIWRQAQKLLILNMALWEWLHVSLENAYSLISTQLPEDLTGLSLLLHRVERAFQTHHFSFFDPADYLIGFTAGETTTQLSIPKNRHFDFGDKSLVIDAATGLLAPWLSFPSREVYQTQAWFTREIINCTGVGALLLPETWDASTAIKACFVPRQVNALATAHERIQTWAQVVFSSHPIATALSLEYRTLQEIDAQVQQISPIDKLISILAYKFSCNLNNTTALSLLPQHEHRVDAYLSPHFPAPGHAASDTLLPASTHLVSSAFPSTSYQSSPPTRNLNIALPRAVGAACYPEGSSRAGTRILQTNPLAGQVPSSPNSFKLRNKAAFMRFYRSIEHLYPFLNTHPINIVVPRPSHDPEIQKQRYIALYQSNVQKFSDKKLPFRDAATSRYRILNSNGPFSPSNISTRSGLFSAIVYRGITHNTPFLLEQPTFFEDLDAWSTLYNMLSPLHADDKKYFCNKSAYGQAIAARGVANVDGFWKATGDPKFSSWLFSDTMIEFMDLYKIFMGLRSFGSLIAYQLAVDYATAGKATVPSLQNMGYIIWKIRAGGLKGLRRLGWVVRDAKSATEAFRNVYHALKHHIPPDMQQRMGFSVFTVEHALCKLSRLDTKGNQEALDDE